MLLANLRDKTEGFIHIRNLKQALNHELVLKKVHRVKNDGKREKTQRHQTCHNIKQKKIFGVWTKLSYYEVIHSYSISNRKEKKADTSKYRYE